MNAVPLFSQPRARLQPGSEAPLRTLAETAESVPGVLQRELEIELRGYRLALSVLAGPGWDTQNNKTASGQNREQRNSTNTFLPHQIERLAGRTVGWSTHPVLVTRLHPQPPGRSPFLFVGVAAGYQGGRGRHRGGGRGARQGWRGGGGRGQLLQLRRPLGVLLLLLLLHQLLGGLEVLQGDALGGPAGLPDPLGVGLSLDLVLLIPHGGDK